MQVLEDASLDSLMPKQTHGLVHFSKSTALGQQQLQQRQAQFAHKPNHHTSAAAQCWKLLCLSQNLITSMPSKDMQDWP